MQRVVELLHHGIAVAAVLYEFVATELDGIVLAYLALHAGIVDTCIAGYEVAVLGVVLQIILYIGGQPELGFHLQRFAVGLAAFVEIGTGGIVDIENAVVALVGLQLALHTAQFAADDDETLIDEVGGIDSHLVLVADSVLVVGSDEHVEHILGT